MNNATYLFIINPKAGTKNYNNIEELIECASKKYTKSWQIIYTQYPNHAFEIVSNADEKTCKAIVAVGGDGTVNEIARALIHKKISLAVVPTGSGNGLARSLKIPLLINDALDLVFVGETYAIDVLQLNEFYSFNVAGTGFDSVVAHSFQFQKKRGFWGYFREVLKQFKKYKPAQAEIILSSSETRTYTLFLLALANSSQFGNNAYIAPRASLNDGKIDLVILPPLSWYKIPYYAYLLFAKKIDRIQKLTYLQINSCQINCNSDIWHIDGEPVVISSPVIINVLPLALKIIVPKSL